MTDFVFSDERQATWDNGGGFDYHSLVAKAPSGMPGLCLSALQRVCFG